MYSEYFALPGEDEADYLLAGLANLIRQRGLETFVSYARKICNIRGIDPAPGYAEPPEAA